MIETDISEKCINTIRFLSADAVQKANSGHPGMPMGAAPMAHVLWSKFMNYNPKDQKWLNRDRFVLSAGHGCMLQYSILHLTGYDLSMEDLKQFRQLGSITPGHPESGLTPGIEVTTGPLGQGFANGVGLAIGQKYLAARYNKPGFDIFNYHIYAICSDGDLMEGISSEAASLAGHLKLGNIIYLYDDNHISIEGDTDIAFTESVAKRFEAFEWQVITVDDVNDIDALEKAIEAAKEETEKPSLIKIRTHIAYGSPNKVNTAGSHGSPLGEDEVRLSKENLGWDPDKHFYVPDDVKEFYLEAVPRGKEKQNEWEKLYGKYKEKHADLYQELEDAINEKLPAGWKDKLPLYKPTDKPVATRKASAKAINAIAPLFPNLIGGSADLAPSTSTEIDGSESFTAKNYAGRNFHFGVREHSMGAIVNGMAITPGIRAFGATFLIFSDYMRPPIRLASIMQINPVFVFTHDSIGLGEDGTTHQPVEQLLALRSIPRITVIRPADANETTHAWRVAIEHKKGYGPVVIVLTRQNLPILDHSAGQGPENLEKGAYILRDTDGDPDLILIATGSEVSVAMESYQELEDAGIKTRVVSMPSWELFEIQDDTYKKSVFPPAVKKRIAIEAGSPIGWHQYVTDEGMVIGIGNRFGESAPGEELMEEYGFTKENVVKQAKKLLKK